MIVGIFGDGPWAQMTCNRLSANPAISIAFICARYKFQDLRLKHIATELGVPFLTTSDVNSGKFMSEVRSSNCDLFVSMSFDQIFKKSMINLCPLGIINCHAGKLPFYRGRNILNWALINDEKEIGVTVHHVDEGIDTGDIISQTRLAISDQDDYNSLLNRAYVSCADLLAEAVEDMRLGRSTRVEQKTIHPVGSYHSARIDGDERLDWNKPSRQVFNFVRALCSPGPGALCYLHQNKVRIYRTEIVPAAPEYIDVPGAVIAVDQSTITVKTADSFVRVLNWSCDKKIKLGDRLK